MGIYTTISDNDSGREGQVKLWNDSMAAAFITFGANVPDIIGHDTYSVAMREGGFLHIRGCVLESWEDQPIEGYMVLDKWGGPYDGTNYTTNDPFNPSNLIREAGLSAG